MISVFDVFKIGIGPSSSHTMGPMVAARLFAEELKEQGFFERTHRVAVELYGSLALTGKGHRTDCALVMGLMGERPETVDLDPADRLVESVRTRRWLGLLGQREIAFHWDKDILFLGAMQRLPKHPNGMRFVAYNESGVPLHCRIAYSVGGGFVHFEGGPDTRKRRGDDVVLPYAFKSGQQMLDLANSTDLPIWKMVLENEKVLTPGEDVSARVLSIWHAMRECMYRGFGREGVLAGGLGVQRRAPKLYRDLCQRDTGDGLTVVDWINAFALAVNEENAAGGRVVTAPTNGAAGVVPAVGQYYHKFIPAADREGLVRYLLTAAAIGALYMENASISGAEVGCQGEVGVACSMAAGGLVAALGGTNEQVEHAAEIGMEHNLGLTCDPVGGLVQIPCIERNAIGAAKAVNAARMSMSGQSGHKVSLDQVMQAMVETGRDMQWRYKETSLGGLAVNVIEC